MYVSLALDNPDIKNGKIFKKALRRSSDLETDCTGKNTQEMIQSVTGGKCC